jgi:hypothetical protein
VVQKTLNTDRGALRVYMIAPPSLEYRWVKGDFIVPVGEELRASSPTDPFLRPDAGPAAAIAPDSFAQPGDKDPFAVPFRPGAAPAAGSASAATSTRTVVATAPAGAKEALAQLDLRYLELLQQSPEHWDLDTLVSDYQALRVHADADLTELIDDRLGALESRRQVWNDYREFVQLTTETSARDAELAAMQAGGVVPAAFDPAAAGSIGVTPIPTTESSATGPTWWTPRAVTAAGATSSQPVVTAPVSNAAAPGSASPLPQFDGAGIVQRMPNRRGQLLHVLADPRGRVLAVLQAPPTFNLDGYVGRSLGVIGHRFHDPRLRTDVIHVQQILPVQLAPQGR